MRRSNAHCKPIPLQVLDLRWPVSTMKRFLNACLQHLCQYSRLRAHILSMRCCLSVFGCLHKHSVTTLPGIMPGLASVTWRWLRLWWRWSLPPQPQLSRWSTRHSGGLLLPGQWGVGFWPCATHAETAWRRWSYQTQPAFAVGLRLSTSLSPAHQHSIWRGRWRGWKLARLAPARMMSGPRPECEERNSTTCASPRAHWRRRALV